MANLCIHHDSSQFSVPFQQYLYMLYIELKKNIKTTPPLSLNLRVIFSGFSIYLLFLRSFSKGMDHSFRVAVVDKATFEGPSPSNSRNRSRIYLPIGR